MTYAPTTNVLYLVVQPIVHITENPILGYGLAEQIITLVADREHASVFFPDDVDAYITAFQWRAEKYFVGGHVTGWEFFKDDSGDGRVIVRVHQNVR
jgi:hypothetical protein